MKKYFFLTLTFIILGATQNISAQKKAKLKDFNALNNFEARDWLTGNFEISKTFVEIYNKNSKKKNFKKHLITYVAYDLDKIYWIATYLNDDYYNTIKDKTMSAEMFQYGVAISENAEENERIRFLFVVGKNYYFQGEKEKSLEYLIPGYELSQKYPGNVPTWNTATESDEIYNFIKSKL